MKITASNVFLNITHSHQIPNGPNVTIKWQLICYISKEGKIRYDLEILYFSEIEVMGLQLSKQPKVEYINETGDKKQRSAINAFDKQMTEMGIDLVSICRAAFEAELEQYETIDDLISKCADPEEQHIMGLEFDHAWNRGPVTED